MLLARVAKNAANETENEEDHAMILKKICQTES
jgi:hypothetical protein